MVPAYLQKGVRDVSLVFGVIPSLWKRAKGILGSRNIINAHGGLKHDTIGVNMTRGPSQKEALFPLLWSLVVDEILVKFSSCSNPSRPMWMTS